MHHRSCSYDLKRFLSSNFKAHLVLKDCRGITSDQKGGKETIPSFFYFALLFSLYLTFFPLCRVECLGNTYRVQSEFHAQSVFNFCAFFVRGNRIVCVCLLILLMSDLVSKQSKDCLLLTTAALIVRLDVTVGQKCCTTRGIRCHLNTFSLGICLK